MKVYLATNSRLESVEVGDFYAPLENSHLPLTRENIILLNMLWDECESIAPGLKAIYSIDKNLITYDWED